MALSVVSFSFSWCSTGGPDAHLSAECWLSLPHLVTNGFLKLLGGPRAPLAWRGFPYHSLSITPTVWLLALTELYNSLMPTQSPTQSLEWHIWSSSSGNNCHAVHGSLSSGASVYECTMGYFLPCPISSAKSRLRDFFRLLAIGMCHFLPVHHFGIAHLPGSKVKIQQLELFTSALADGFHWSLSDSKSGFFCGQPGQQSRLFCKFSFFFFLLIIKSGLLAGIIIIYCCCCSSFINIIILLLI